MTHNLSKAGWSWALQLWTHARERFSLLIGVATLESVSLCGDEKLTAFVELDP